MDRKENEIVLSDGSSLFLDNFTTDNHKKGFMGLIQMTHVSNDGKQTVRRYRLMNEGQR